MKRLSAVAAATVSLSLFAAACGSDNNNDKGTSGKPGAGKPPVTLGAKNFTEQFVLGQLYAQALRAKGYKVTLKSNIGSTEIIDKSLTSGRLDLYPEYTGIMLTTVFHDNKAYADEQAAYAAAKAAQEKRGFTLLDKTPFSDVDALAVKPAYAKEYKLRSVADLGKVDEKVKVGAPPTFESRWSAELAKVYGVKNLQFVPLTIGLQYKALDSGKVQAADVFTTDGQLQRGKYTVLTDPKGLFGFQNVSVVVSKKVLANEGSAFAETLNAVTAKLTTAAMESMNAAIDLDKNSPAAVAKKFLAANALL